MTEGKVHKSWKILQHKLQLQNYDAGHARAKLRYTPPILSLRLRTGGLNQQISNKIFELKVISHINTIE